MPAHEVHVGIASPQQIPDWRSLAALLDAQEHLALAALKFEEDRRAYALAHALRRAMLSRELRVPPASLRFVHDDKGRPLLAGEHAQVAQVFFSHSRSRAVAACAVTRLAPVGIDVEPIDPARADAELLEPFVEDADAEFFRDWTSLEAFWKCKGTGLSEGNPRIRFAEGQGDRRAVLMGSGGPAGLVMRLRAAHNCAAALALDAPVHTPLQLRVFRCNRAVDVAQLCCDDVTMKFISRVMMDA